MVGLRISGRCRGPRGVIAASLALGLVWVLPAHAELRACNQTLGLYNVAVGYFTGEHCQPGDPLLDSCHLVTEGWWNLAANSCVTLIKEPLDQGFYYVFALDIYGNDAVTGDTPLCVNTGRRFTIQTLFVERQHPRCWQRGYQQVKFREIDVKGKEDWTVFVQQGGG